MKLLKQRGYPNTDYYLMYRSRKGNTLYDVITTRRAVNDIVVRHYDDRKIKRENGWKPVCEVPRKIIDNASRIITSHERMVKKLINLLIWHTNNKGCYSLSQNPNRFRKEDFCIVSGKGDSTTIFHVIDMFHKTSINLYFYYGYNDNGSKTIGGYRLDFGNDIPMNGEVFSISEDEYKKILEIAQPKQYKKEQDAVKNMFGFLDL